MVLSIVAVAPSRGTVSNRVIFKRSRAEFWSTYNVDFGDYVAGDARVKLEVMCKALIGAANQVPDKRMPAEEKRQFEAALWNGVTLLLAEPERIKRFQRPFQIC